MSELVGVDGDRVGAADGPKLFVEMVGGRFGHLDRAAESVQVFVLDPGFES